MTRRFAWNWTSIAGSSKTPLLVGLVGMYKILRQMPGKKPEPLTTCHHHSWQSSVGFSVVVETVIYSLRGAFVLAFVTAAISCSTTLLPDLLPNSSTSLTLLSVSFFASSSAFLLPELCCTVVRVSCPSGYGNHRTNAHLLLEFLVLCFLLLLVVLNFLLCLASCVLYSLCTVFND